MKKLKLLFGLLLIVLPVTADELGSLASALKDISMASKKMDEKYKPVFTKGVEYIFSQVGGPSDVKIYIKHGNMFEQGAQVIVNAANIGLHGGAGVDAAVEKATKQYSGKNDIVACCWKSGTPQDWDEGKAFLNTAPEMRIAFDHTTQTLVDKKTAESGKNINIMRVIQAVGPRCSGGEVDIIIDNLKNVYFNALKAADDNTLTSIALPFISGGIFGCGHRAGASSAIAGIMGYLEQHSKTHVHEIHCCLFSEEHYNLFLDAINKWQDNNKNKSIKLTGPTSLQQG